jgi:hypothetical protein
MVESTETRTEKGASLARGPALITGTILLAIGLYSLYKQHYFPPFSNFPNGKAPVDGKVLGIFGVNGWTGMLTAVGGGLLLFGAAQHLLAKTMSLIVGVALGAAAIIALVSGNVLGMAAANHWTELGWGIVAVILLFNTLIPRRRTTVDQTGEPVIGRRRHRARTAAEVGAVGAGAAVAEHEHDKHREAEREQAPVGARSDEARNGEASNGELRNGDSAQDDHGANGTTTEDRGPVEDRAATPHGAADERPAETETQVHH